MDVHELVAALKQWIVENGRVPTRGEFCAAVPGSHYALGKMGGFTPLLHAAGVSSYRDRQARGQMSERLTDELFVRPIPDVLASHIPEPQIAQPQLPHTIIIPDTHFPWVNERVLEAVYKKIQRAKPGLVIQIGDLFDLYSHSRFPKSMNIYKPQEEEQLARAGAEKMWKTIRGIVPEAECVQIKGNHDIRPLKKTLEKQPEIEHVVAKHYDLLMTFDGVTLVSDPRQEYIRGNVEFIHDYRGRIGEHRDYALMNAVCGHIHVGGVSFRKIRGQVLWELNCGLAGDPEAKALGYTPQKITNWTPGYGEIDGDGPRFISA